MPFAPWFVLAWIRAPPTISEEAASRLHLVERGKKNVRVSRVSCVEWSDARESVFMVCGRRPRRVLKLRSRKTDAVRKLSVHHSPLLFTSQTHVCSDTGAAHDQRRHTPWCSDGICANTQKLCHLKTGSLVTGQLHQTRPHSNHSSTWSSIPLARRHLRRHNRRRHRDRHRHLRRHHRCPHRVERSSGCHRHRRCCPRHCPQLFTGLAARPWPRLPITVNCG